MKRRTWISLLIVFSVILSGTIFAFNQPFSNTNDTYQIVKVGDKSIFIPRMSQQDKQNIAYYQKADDIIADPTRIRDIIQSSTFLDYDLLNQFQNKLNASKLSVPYPEGTLYLEKLKFNGKTIVTSEKGMTTPYLKNSEDFSLYTFTSNSSNIYVYNSKNNTVKKVTKDIVGRFDKQNLIKKPTKNRLLYWADFPMISDDNSFIAYRSNRRSFVDENDSIDIWIADLTNGEERILVKDATMPLTWVGRTLYYKTLDHKIERIDIDTNSISVLTSLFELAQIQNDLIIYQKPYDTTYYVYNTLTDQSYSFDTDNPNSRIPFEFKVSNDNKKILGTIFVDRKVAESNKFLIIDLEKNTQQLMDIPTDRPTLSQLEGWLDNHHFAATIYKDNGRSSETLIFSIGGVQ